MSDIKDLFTQSSHYFLGHFLIAAAGFASFPILTRLFKVSDYGLLGLINTTLFITIGICKLGMPNAVVRFYAEAEKESRLKTFFATTVTSGAIGGIIGGCLIWVAVVSFLENSVPENVKEIVALLFGLIACGCVADILISFLRVQQRTKLYNAVLVTRKYGGLILGVFLAMTLRERLSGFLWGQLIGTAVVLSILMFIVTQSVNMRGPLLSRDILKEAFAFGFPLIWAELGHLLLNYADRYLIQFYMGAEPLGIYTAGYNLATHVAEGIMYPINYAMTPIYLSILVNKGMDETKVFFTSMFTYFLLILIPCIFGFIAIGNDLVVLLASDKYEEASTVIPYVIVGQGVYACSIVLNSGLFIAKKTRTVTFTMVFALALNVGMNILLIPRFGIVGAAVSTLVSFMIYTVVVTWFAFKEFSFKIEVKRVGGFLLSATAMSILVTYSNFFKGVGDLIFKVFFGMLCYSILVFLVDGDLRRKMLGFRNRTR